MFKDETKNDKFSKSLFENKIVWDMNDLCKFLGITRECAYSRIRRGQIPTLGRRNRKDHLFDPRQVVESLKN